MEENMNTQLESWNRRRFVTHAAMASLLAGFSARSASATISPVIDQSLSNTKGKSIYADLGVRPLINAAGTYTMLSGCTMSQEVVVAMEEASRQHVSILELQEAVGKRISALVGSEAAMVTAGCAAALTVATAACVSGADPDKIRRVPESSGMKNEVIFQKSHRFGYDHAIRNVGVKIVEVETRQELEAAINDKTAMLFFLNLADPKGQIKKPEFVEIAKKAGIPSLIDAAADVPPAENLTSFLKMGFDLVAFSGGKGLRGPQCSGLLLGRHDLIQAGLLNGSPNSDTVARTAKVGKEEIIGLLTAVELYLKRDHRSEWQEWEQRVKFIADELSRIRTVKTERFVPEIANQVPHLAVKWDAKALGLSRDNFEKSLREGNPRIETRPGITEEGRLEIGVWMLHPGEHQIVARRCAEILKKAAQSA
jgi:L-seryl-tRNA(Ser) seleniumtransferase